MRCDPAGKRGPAAEGSRKRLALRVLVYAGIAVVPGCILLSRPDPNEEAWRSLDPEASRARDVPEGLANRTHVERLRAEMERLSPLHCNMCGSNHREESDRRPIALCPECVAKVAWATGADLASRYRGLAEFARAQGLVKEAEFYERSIEALAADE